MEFMKTTNNPIVLSQKLYDITRFIYRCYSSVGRQDGGQVISLGTTCEARYRALHEIMHALGFLHEHSRPDRDQYVKILHWNIEDGKLRIY